MSKFTIELLFCHNIKINTFASLSCMSEEQSRAGMYPEWPAICDPTKKFYDPFEEYSACDGQRGAEKKPSQTRLDKVIEVL